MKFLSFIGSCLMGPRLQLWALILAGPAMSGFLWWLIKLIASVHWGPEHYTQQIAALSYTMYGVLGSLLLIIIALTAGLIRGVKLTAGNTSVDIDLDDDDDKDEGKT